MARSKQAGRKFVNVKARRNQLKTLRGRYVSWRDMDAFLSTGGYLRATAADLAVAVTGDTFYIRVDKYVDDGGKDCSVLWAATYITSATNANTGTREHLFDYSCTSAHLVYPQNVESLLCFGGNRVSLKNSDVLVYMQRDNACGCLHPTCYFCTGGSDD